MNNGKYDTESYRLKQSQKIDRLWGPIIEHKKICQRCNEEYIWKGREKTKEFLKSKYCSRSCANNRKDWWKENAKQYRTIALQNYEHKCVVCGFDKIIDIHHIDENKKNNNPTNLIPLCPNHHQMLHSKYRNDIEPFIKEWQSKIFGELV